jgi:hypothetical protein
MRIIITHIFPPIPTRAFDYRATMDNYEPGCSIGHGATPDEACEELLATMTHFYVDDALSPRTAEDMPANARLVGWHRGFEPVFVAVWSHLLDEGSPARLDPAEAEEAAADYLAEIGWFAGEPTPADYVL